MILFTKNWKNISIKYKKRNDMTKIYLPLLNQEVDDEKDFDLLEEERYMRENFDEIDPGLYERLERCYYYPSDFYELYDAEMDQWFNMSGQSLRNPEEYDVNTEGYTPFGDE